VDEVQKSKIRLTHWIDHNLDHLQGYGEVARILEKSGFSQAATKIREGMRLIEAANSEFTKALGEISEQGTTLSGPGETVAHQHDDLFCQGHRHSHGKGPGTDHEH